MTKPMLKNNSAILIKKTLTVILVGVFLFTNTLGWAKEERLFSTAIENKFFSSRPADNNKLSPESRLNSDEFKTSFTVAAICKHVEHDGNLDDKSYLNDVLARLDAEKNSNITVLPYEIIIEIPNEGLAVRYFDPTKANVITPFSDISKLETKVIGPRLNRQVIHRIKVLPFSAGQQIHNRLEPPSLEIIESKIFAVHATPIFPLNGILKAGALKKSSRGKTTEEPPSFRPVIHFSLGELVQENQSANWEDVPYVIVTPLATIEKQLINISPYDSFILGDFKLTQDCVLIVPKGTDISTVPKYVEIKEYEAKIGLRAAVEQVIKDKEGWQINMVPSKTSIGAVAYLNNIDINYPEFFTSLFEKLPQLSYGNDVNSERGNAFRFGAIEQALHYALTKLTTLPILELRFYRAVIAHNLEELEKTLRSQSFSPEAMAVFEDKKSNVLRWVSDIDKEMERRPNDTFEISPTVLAVFLYMLSPQELNEFVAKNEGLFLYTDSRKFNIEYAIRRWLLVKSEQAKREGLNKILDESFNQIKTSTLRKASAEWPFDIVKEFLTMDSNRLGVALEILRHDAFSDYLSMVHGIVFKDNGPQTLEDVLRAYPMTKILFDTQTYALSPDQQIAAQFLQKIDRIYQTAIAKNALRDISEATHAAIEKKYLHNRLKKDLDTIMLPMNTAKGIEEMQIGDDLNLYQLLKQANENAMEIWKKVGLEKEFRRMFPNDELYWKSELSLFEIYQKLLRDSGKSIPYPIGNNSEIKANNHTEYIEKNKLLFKDMLGENKPDTLVRVPVEAIESIGIDNIKDFLATFQGAPNGYVELYYMSGIEEVAESIYRKYGLQKKPLPKEFKRTRENTVTLFPALKGEEINQSAIVSRLGNLDVTPENTILSPIGLQHDQAGLIRATILGLKMMDVARQIKEKGIDITKDQAFKDKIQLEILEQLKNVCDVDDLKNFNLTPDDIIALATGNINNIIIALKKLIKLLPITPIDAEELRQIYEHAKLVITAA